MKVFVFFVLLVQLLFSAEMITVDKESGTGTITFTVDKNIDKVMQEILNLQDYPQKIEDVEKVDIYFSSQNKYNATIYISSFFIDFQNSVTHEIDRYNHTVKWHLDETKENYFKEMNGFWKLEKIDDNITQVRYQNQLKFKGWIPSFLENYLLEKGLRKSTRWLKLTRF